MKILCQSSDGRIVHRNGDYVQTDQGYSHLHKNWIGSFVVYEVDSVPENARSFDGSSWTYPLTADQIPAPDKLIRKKVREAKDIAKQKINAVMPDYKQRNSLSRLAELQILSASNALTQEGQDEMNDILGLWSRIKAIRDASNDIEQSFSAMTKAEIKLVMVEDCTEWPE